ncbi:hypothetical protein J3A83DRAFT_4188393 [Scleroderma citrinum]
MNPYNSMYPGTTWQDREQAMEAQIIRLTTEHDTIKSAFELLANTMQLPLSDPLQFNPAAIQQLPTPHSIHPTPESHPLIHFWTQKDWNKWLMSPEAQMSTCRRYGFLEDEKGELLSDSILKEICKIACGG